MGATAIDKTAFNPYIAQFGMPSQGMFSAFGGAVDDYEKKQKIDRMFALDVGNKELDQKSKQFEVDTLNPLKADRQRNLVTSTALDTEQKTYLQKNGAWDDAITKSHNDALKSDYEVTTSKVQSEYADQTEKGKLAVQQAQIGASNASANSSNFGVTEKTLNKKDEYAINTLYAALKDIDGDGKISEAEYAQHEKDVREGKITIKDPFTKEERTTTPDDARLFATAKDMHLKSVADLQFKNSQTFKNNETKAQSDALSKKIAGVKANGEALATELGVTYEDLATVDVTKLTPQQQVKLQSVGSQYLAAHGEKDDVKKSVADLNQNTVQLTKTSKLTQKAIDNGNNVQFVDQALNEIASYTGVAFNKEVALRNKEFQGVLNTQLKIMSGTSVSAQEYERFKTQTSTLWKTNRDLMLGMQELAETQMARLEGFSMGMGALPFNAKYGKLYANTKALNDSFASQTETGQQMKRSTKTTTASPTPTDANLTKPRLIPTDALLQ